MVMDFAFTVKRIRFDEDYRPSENTRITTNFANLARGENRVKNLHNTMRMINNRCNALAFWDNPESDRYVIALDILSIEISLGASAAFPAIEMLKTSILDRKYNTKIEGIVGNNFSSYVRDYDFSIRLHEYNKDRSEFSVPGDFGDLHGKIFKLFVNSTAYSEHSAKPPVICLSVSHNKTYQRSANRHPVLGVEYLSKDGSLTEEYFRKMGMQVRYFMPENSSAPLAFYFFGDLLNEYSNLELIGTIGTMETFQKIYRPEIYNANSPAPEYFQPKLEHQDYSVTQITYDREERVHLALSQGRYAEKTFIEPYRTLLHG
ncbi:MAG: putative oxygenase MesX [Acetobacter aceti]|uniref:DUF1852 domain-containing protein n=1 Tax=Acetobacter aceti TaxID=435 RepID=A0A1U9KCN5_ACEAC|nr:putative oxygenase MesX [Acetobacter aceti]AQS83585.1 hypothetical protein A0U92_01040 [Acetobacter aceti]